MTVLSIKDIVFYDDTPIFDAPYLPSNEKIVAGSPKQKVSNLYSDPSNQFHCGVWASEPGQWQISYTEHEFCYITKGRSILHDENGGQKELKVGDRFVIPAGFKGSWEVVESCEKLYVIYEQN